MNREDLARMFAARGYTLGYEIGTASGVFAETLLKANPGLTLFCVDPWMRYDGYDQMWGADLEECYREAQILLAPHTATLLRMTSEQAAAEVADDSIDFVYIDANHHYEWVSRDLELWHAKVRPGGIVSGHDYHSMTSTCQVQRAVDNWVTMHRLKLHVLDDRYHSWYYEKGTP